MQKATRTKDPNIKSNAVFDNILKSNDSAESDQYIKMLELSLENSKSHHHKVIRKLDDDIKVLEENRRIWDQEQLENVEFRDRLEVELTKFKFKEMFYLNQEYLQQIKDGKVESFRQEMFLEGQGKAGILKSNIVIHPFTEEQFNWAMEEFNKVIRVEFDQIIFIVNNIVPFQVWIGTSNDYIVNVLMSELFVKIYSDLFNLTISDSEKRIFETPVSDDDNSDLL